jgi:hypothetical protein
MGERDEHDQTRGAPDTSTMISTKRAVPKDNDELRRVELQLRAAVRKLEHIGALMDALQHEVENIGPWLAHPAAQRIMGAGIIGLVIKAETLAKAVTAFASALRRNDLQQRLPPEGRDT